MAVARRRCSSGGDGSRPAASRVLALDFDGVISDSAGEAMVVAARTWRALHPEEPFGRLLEPLARGDDPSPTGLEQLTSAFRDLLPLGNRAEDFGVALWILARREHVGDQRAYDAVRSGFDSAWTTAFHERFYTERARLRSDDPVRWIALQRPYTPIVDLLWRRHGEVELALATAKDRASVRVLLGAYGVDALFPEHRVWDKETGVDKGDHLTAIAEHLEVSMSRITFVDDKLNHLERTRHLGVRGVLAGWGFNGPREARAARDAGFEVATTETAEAVLFESPKAGC